jgi:glyoxalase family protein
MPAIRGLHHVTAVAAATHTNRAFYADTLGLRLVKRTVNHDDPGAHHRYYGDHVGTPGTLLSFFIWGGATQGVHGAGTASTVALRVPPGALEYWAERLQERGVMADGPYERDTERVLSMRDPDGLELELVERADESDPATDTIPAEYAIRGLDGVALSVREPAATGDLLATLGCTHIGTVDGRQRYRAGDGPGGLLDLVGAPEARTGRSGTGAVHHVALRVPDRDALETWRERLADRGRRVTQVIDRRYFESVYFRGPGGVLFELATDGPGMTVDEDEHELGTALQLPPWLEDQREGITEQLPSVDG